MAQIRAIAIIGTLVIGAVTLIVITLNRDSQEGVTVVQSCPSGYLMIDTTMPDPDQLVINVYNATTTPGLATKVKSDFGYRNVKVEKTGNSKKGYPDAVAVLRYGPDAYGAAHVLQGYFLNAAINEFDPEREGALVDVYIGGKYAQLATQTEFNQAIGHLGRPSAPPGTCEKS